MTHMQDSSLITEAVTLTSLYMLAVHFDFFPQTQKKDVND